MVQEWIPFASAGSGGRFPCRVALWAALLLGGGCSEGSGPRAFDAPRMVEGAAAELRWDATTAERFGLAPAGAPGDDASGAGLAWTVPAGWIELPASAMRAASFRVAGDPRAECSLVLLPGDAGGLSANVDRWRGQMGLAPLGADELEALPRGELLGGPAVRVDFEGTYSGMGGEARAGQRMVGLLRVEATGSSFLKMVGPADVVAAELEAFDELARSLRPAAGAGEHGPHDGHDHGAPAGPAAPATPAQGLSWEAPDGWTRGPERPFRAVSFELGEGGAVECYVSVLNGDGGGALANANRWLGQMGAPPIDRGQLAQLERLPMAGADALLLEALGAYRGMSGETVAGARLLGALAIGPDRSVFVKMIGPAADVDAARGEFLTFCRSLRLAR